MVDDSLNNNGLSKTSSRQQVTKISEIDSSARDSSSAKIRNRALTQIDNSFQSNSSEQGFAAAKTSADKALAANQIILNNRFVLKEMLGAGGMGAVYRAEDLRKIEARDSNPFVATKILNSDFKDHPDAFISLQREASRSHLLSHPNIVTVHDFDRDGDTIFMTMELLDGMDLELLLSRQKNSPLPTETVISILKDFCEALVYAHSKGIIHSDLKPGNIFVTKNEGAKILDFGIARLALGSQTEDHFDAGRIGAITPAYASLEMLAHKAPDASDDVYAAAIIVYELLTGKHPFQTRSAAVALANGLKPERIESLSSRQWNALSNALELKRENRTKSIKELLDGFTIKPALPIYRSLSIVLVTVVSWFVYSEYFGPNELRTVIEDTMLKAKQCFKEEDFACAVESANAVLEISPRNNEARILGEKASLEKEVAEIEFCIETHADISCALSHLETLVEMSPDTIMLERMTSLINSQKDRYKTDQLMLEAESCYSKSDHICVQEELNQIFEITPKHNAALALSEKNKTPLLQQVASIKLQNEAFTEDLSYARNCYLKKDFACAEERSSMALKIKPSNQEALNLYQDATFENKQQQKNQQKANSILRDGQSCLKKLDYSCAIAKSEAALVFVPDYDRALSLKRKATQALNAVKNKIEIE